MNQGMKLFPAMLQLLETSYYTSHTLRTISVSGFASSFHYFFLRNKKQTLQWKFRSEAAKLIQPNIQEISLSLWFITSPSWCTCPAISSSHLPNHKKAYTLQKMENSIQLLKKNLDRIKGTIYLLLDKEMQGLVGKL